MRRGDRRTVRITPENPMKDLDIVIATQGAAAARSYVVAVTARDVEGEIIEPTDARWRWSDAVGAFFQYSEESTGEGTIAVRRWSAASWLSSLEVDVVGWEAEESSLPEVLAVSVSPVHSEGSGGRVWTVLRPTSGVPA